VQFRFERFENKYCGFPGDSGEIHTALIAHFGGRPNLWYQHRGLSGGSEREGASRLGVAGVLVPLAAVCATVAVGFEPGAVRTCALGPPARLRERYLEGRYGTPVPLATGHRIVAGRSHWSWVCPHCGHRNEGASACESCGAVFDGVRYRVKKAL
jgi:hypothetical protein